ncbi:arsenic transporter [Paenibacillus oenotherae]|uniref:Arsenic transporter n=1 Tax=Paenibacillus oenotherae TaxID=1435645 RepID=A0ABS7D3G1_9BACL|nr:ArsB/NhaD family transporter [Paenibacillus oenotherae]MBW7474464.1 arsenic transporter [Paenibacillus oenotherae]
MAEAAEPLLVILVFLLTIASIIWRPKGINEAVPAAIGAAVLLLAGIVPLSELGSIVNRVSGSAVTVLCTLIMAMILDNIGFFRWASINVITYARGSGVRLFVGVICLCFLMTLFFNDYASILITTPIILQIVSMLRLRIYQQLPYLISGALIAIAASAPIGASHLSTLLTLRIAGMNLNAYAELLFIPAMVGIVSIAFMLYVFYHKQLPSHISTSDGMSPASYHIPVDWSLFRICMIIVVATRAGFFIGSSFGVAMEWIAIVGVLLMLLVRWWKTGRGPKDLVFLAPWSILLFAFSIYVIVDGLQGIGITRYIALGLSAMMSSNDLSAVVVSGGLLTILSNFLNNLPAALIGTLSLTQMNLEPQTLQLAYLANILGSDVGALITPIGTLASLIWLFILRQHDVQLSWKDYMKVTVVIIPAGLLISLLSLYAWTRIIG